MQRGFYPIKSNINLSYVGLNYLHVQEELHKVKKRRTEREREREEREKEQELLQREKEAAYYREWAKQEDTVSYLIRLYFFVCIFIYILHLFIFNFKFK